MGEVIFLGGKLKLRGGFSVALDAPEARIQGSLLESRQRYPYFLVYLSDLSGGGWHLMI